MILPHFLHYCSTQSIGTCYQNMSMTQSSQHVVSGFVPVPSLVSRPNAKRNGEGTATTWLRITLKFLRDEVGPKQRLSPLNQKTDIHVV